MSNEDHATSPVAPESHTEDDALIVFGQSVIDRVTFISSTYTSLLMFMGRHEKSDSAVLVPFVEVKFDGPSGEGEPSTTLFSESMPLENVAFVLEDVSSDMIAVLSHLKAVSSGQVKLEPRRLSATKEFLSQAKLNLEKCLIELEAVER